MNGHTAERPTHEVMLARTFSAALMTYPRRWRPACLQLASMTEHFVTQEGPSAPLVQVCVM